MTHSTARGRAPVRSPAPYSDEVARAICEATEAGARLATICRRKGMPPRATVEHWLMAHAEFADAYALALAAGGARRKGPTYDREVAVALCERLGAGEALYRICLEPGMPTEARVHRWVSRHPEFAVLYRLACEIQMQRLIDEVREIADGATPTTLQIARTRIAARQWQASKLAPRKASAAESRDDPREFNVEVVTFGREDPDTE